MIVFITKLHSGVDAHAPQGGEGTRTQAPTGAQTKGGKEDSQEGELADRQGGANGCYRNAGT
ncbi:hypothetical protein KIF24_13820 [Micromonospora sp. Llam7]|uniref:hypothetical protein n=1 Tax=Micromonospora tarapacensis TaxID=2835305 RepID=UPI001C83CC47|nr:hypothetical protein [Micromonospora tarapacensis]MBX7266995.1 hypothetical protein [Micromonospora tarapacensis]